MWAVCSPHPLQIQWNYRKCKSAVGTKDRFEFEWNVNMRSFRRLVQSLIRICEFVCMCECVCVRARAFVCVWVHWNASATVYWAEYAKHARRGVCVCVCVLFCCVCVCVFVCTCVCVGGFMRLRRLHVIVFATMYVCTFIFLWTYIGEHVFMYLYVHCDLHVYTVLSK